MSEILKRLQESMEKAKKKPPKKEIPSEPKKVKRKPRRIEPKVQEIPRTKRNVQHLKSQLLQLLTTVNFTEFSPKQKRALKSLGAAEPFDKSDRKLVTLWDQKKTTLASLELLLSIFMQQPVEIKLKG